MIKIVKIFFIITFTFLCVLKVNAQHSGANGMHGNGIAPKLPPHGGEVKEAGKYKIEMVANLFLKKDQLLFYVYKGDFKVISNKGIEGTIVLKPKEKGNITTQKLQAKDNDFFVAQLNNTNSFYVTAKFIIKGKVVSAMFAQYGIGHQHAVIYTCTMHPEIESSQPGECPKCGMTLVKKKD